MNKNKFSLKNILLSGATVLLSGAALTSCNFLDLKPLDTVSPDNYYTTAEQLGGFTIKKYPSIFRNNSGWYAGRATFDDGTDNQAAPGGNEGMFYRESWRVPTNGSISFNPIRDVNKFIKEIEEKHANHGISGEETMINHYIGEAYVIRAMLYYDRLVAYGDYPILLEEINVDGDLVGTSKRQPRNEVARHILKDLDTAISMLQNDMNNNLRITKKAALVLKSRVALFEGTFELYHRGTGRVPGDQNWPGRNKEWNQGKTFDQQAEVDFFLTEAMNAAKEVAEQISLTTENNHIMDPKVNEFNGWNPYYDMFASEDLTKYPEVILWEQYNADVTVAHLTSNKLRMGSATGWTRGLVESFLMKNGLPIYAANSGYHQDVTIDNVKMDRDERLQLFIFGESNNLSVENGEIKKFTLPFIIDTNEKKDVTGYRQRKFYNYNPAMQNGQTFSDVSGQIHIRVAEAYLNYIEASYVKNHTLDNLAKKYWNALRKRAGITASIETTINATDMSYETNVNRPSYDWGAFSGGNPLTDATLYSIRRERRSEFAGEGYRMNDLKRWAALDQVRDYQIEGVNFWARMHNDPQFKNEDGSSKLVSDGGEKANISGANLSTYLHPYQIRSNYNLYNGYTFSQAHYLSPFSFEEMRLASPSGDVNNSNLYQNIYWPTQPGGMAEK